MKTEQVVVGHRKLYHPDLFVFFFLNEWAEYPQLHFSQIF